MLGHISFIVSIVGVVPYVWLVLKGRVKPERATWGIWTLILVLSVLSYRAEGADESLWFLLGDLLITSVVFALSLWRGKGGYDKHDLTCVGVALGGLLLWFITHYPLLQLIGVMTADVIAIVPTLRKTLESPQEESFSTYAASALAALMGVFAVGRWDSILIAYPLYLYTANLIVAIVVYTAQRVASQEAR